MHWNICTLNTKILHFYELEQSYLKYDLRFMKKRNIVSETQILNIWTLGCLWHLTHYIIPCWWKTTSTFSYYFQSLLLCYFRKSSSPHLPTRQHSAHLWCVTHSLYGADGLMNVTPCCVCVCVAHNLQGETAEWLVWERSSNSRFGNNSVPIVVTINNTKHVLFKFLSQPLTQVTLIFMDASVISP